MHRDGYEQIQSYESKTSLNTCETPIIIPESDSDIWEDVSEQVELFVSQKNSESNLNLRVWFTENIFNLISGTVNLLNFIIKSYDKEPIKTLVFLDKSARLGAHIFRTLWHTLEKQNKLPTAINMPAIKFINVGLGENHKHEADKTLNILSEVFAKKDFEGGGFNR